MLCGVLKDVWPGGQRSHQTQPGWAWLKSIGSTSQDKGRASGFLCNYTHWVAE